MTDARLPVYLNALGIINALGADRATVLANLLAGTAPGMHAAAGKRLGFGLRRHASSGKRSVRPAPAA